MRGAFQVQSQSIQVCYLIAFKKIKYDFIMDDFDFKLVKYCTYSSTLSLAFEISDFSNKPKKSSNYFVNVLCKR